MPFTLSHPFIVLPLHRYRLLHFPALVIGALSPDFPYYLHGRPYPGGHSWPSVLYYDVPLTALVYLLSLALLSPCLRRYLPDCLNAAYPPPAHFSRRWQTVVVFALSAALGAATHIVLDGFTHPNGWFVQHLPRLQQPAGALPLYQWVQHVLSIGGLMLLAAYQWLMARHFPHRSPCGGGQKICFWLGVVALGVLTVLLWQLLQPATAFATGSWGRLTDISVLWTIRFTDAVLLLLCASGLWLRLRTIQKTGN